MIMWIGLKAMERRRPVLLGALAAVALSVQVAHAQNCVFPSESFWGQIDLLSLDEAIPGVSDEDEFEFISKLAAGHRPAELLALENLPADPRSPLGGYARPIGRVDIEFTYMSNGSERSCMYPCTGWLIAPSLVITNAHCTKLPATPVGIGVRRGRASFLLGYETGLLAGEFFELDPEPLESGDSHTLDYSILEVVGARPGDRYGTVKPYVGEIYKSHELVMVGHPMGFRKQVIRANCFNGEYPFARPPFMYHECATVGGMSGSPILDAYSGTVIALHKGAAASDINRGVLIDRIVEESDIMRQAMEGRDPLETLGASVVIGPEPYPCTGGDLIYLDPRCANPGASLAFFPVTATLARQNENDTSRIVEIVQQANSILERARDAGVNCPVEVRLVGKPVVLEDGLVPQRITSQADFDLLGKLPGNIHFVDELTVCGNSHGISILECTRLHDYAVIKRDMLALPNGGAGLLHSIGHLSGALHKQGDPTHVMSTILTKNLEDINVDAGFCAQVAAEARDSLTTLAISLPR